VNPDNEILRAIHIAFRDCPRPEHFTDYTHCAECEEHDEVLRSRDVETLSFNEVGNAGWDPICFLSPAGFAYYLPALARLALDPPDEQGNSYLRQFLFHLQYDGRGNERWQHCTPKQRAIVVAFLHHVIDTRAEVLDGSAIADDAFLALDAWTVTPELNGD